jgi:hypothetical protein
MLEFMRYEPSELILILSQLDVYQNQPPSV